MGGRGREKGKGKGADKGRGKAAGGKGSPGGNPERSDHTKHFYPVDEVLSSLQKAVRRGHTSNAAFWAGELHVSGLSVIALKRLLIMAVEDVGITSPYAPFAAATAQAMVLTMPEEEEAGDSALVAGPRPTPERLALVCGLARWLSGLPKTRTSCMLSAFQRAKAEERHRSSAGPLAPCGVDAVAAALAKVYGSCADVGTFLAAGSRDDDDDDDVAFLALEEEVFMTAYAFQLCQKTEAASLAPTFDALDRAMLAEDQRLRAVAARTSAHPIGEATMSAECLAAGYGAVRRMVSDLQQMSTGALDSAARLVLNQALLLATRAHRLVRDGLIVVPSMVAQDATPPSLREVAARCGGCGHALLDGRALARRNARQVAKYARLRPGGVAISFEAFVRTEIIAVTPDLVPPVIFDCLFRHADDARARLLRVPQYCVDIHTRRGSGYPMHRDWEQRLVPQHPGLQEWDEEEVRKTHGELDAEGRRIAHQFSHYGLVVSDEYFPAPARPAFSMQLRPGDWQHFLSHMLPVASLDHGEAFIDRRSFPHGYESPASRKGGARPGDVQPLAGRISEGMAVALAGDRNSTEGPWCACGHADAYAKPATPHDPYFAAAKTFMAWSAERSFPAASDFPGGRLPKVLESTAFSTIRDDPTGGRRQTQVEHLLEMTEGPASGALVADEKRSAIDSRPSAVTELHRARMHEVLERGKAPATASAVAARSVGLCPRPAAAGVAVAATGGPPAPPPIARDLGGEPARSAPPPDSGGAGGARKSRWGRK
mmetsp:Transcript_40429/g.116221  ORF Transcript_40429/g.116221 Transcript_40429/m.116221 type:complete len:771 (-) Transcript_40429:38-2350(-)